MAAATATAASVSIYLRLSVPDENHPSSAFPNVLPRLLARIQPGSNMHKSTALHGRDCSRAWASEGRVGCLQVCSQWRSWRCAWKRQPCLLHST